ncbi:TonB-dependent receptor [Aurantiacibacter flavus]|uniref:TonB-dependent receptor n=1 Tax=Aurantiacibacter flavus TaxID=3145232 RepID=A0ABV0CV36_9SPHN
MTFCTHIKPRMLMAGVALTAIGWSSLASAQDGEGGANSSDGFVGNAIVVTAQRQAQSLDDVPISVAAFDTRAMDERGVRSIDDLSQISPGLVIQRSDTRNASAARISIRGINSAAGAATTGIYIDDVPIQARSLGYASYSVFPQVFDLERVEVLRGPQGTLFGAGAQGGAVRFITPDPSLYDLSVYGRGEVSTTEKGDESWELGAAVGVPLIEGKLALRVSAWHRFEGGYVDRMVYDRPNGGGPYISSFYLNHPYYQATYPGLTPVDGTPEPTTGTIVEKDSNYLETDIVRAALRFTPTDELDITASVFYQNTYSNDSATYWLNLSDVENHDFVQGNNQAQPSSDEFYIPSLEVEYDAGPFSIVSTTSYFKRDQEAFNDYTTFEHAIYFGSYLSDLDESTDAYQFNEQENFTQELRFQSNGGGPVNWVLGFFYTDNKQEARQYNDISTLPVPFPEMGCPPSPVPPFVVTPPFCYGAPVEGSDRSPVDGAVLGNALDPMTLDETQAAVFAQVDYDITERLTLTAGVRVAKTDVDISATNYGPIVGPEPVIAEAQQSETPITPKFGLNYQINDDTLVYASVAKGFRTGGGNPEIGQGCNLSLSQNGLSFYDSDSLWSYEVGAKGGLFNNRLQINASGYYIEWDNIQQNIGLPCGFQFVINGGSAVSKGFDADITIWPTDQLMLSTAVGYNHAEFRENVPNPAGAGNLLSAGDRVAGSPWQVATSAMYEVPMGSVEGYLRGDWNYVSAWPDELINQNPANTSYNAALRTQPGYHQVNLRAGVRLDTFDVSLFVRNVFNDAPELGYGQSPAAFSAGGPDLYQAVTVRPRTFGLTLVGRY